MLPPSETSPVYKMVQSNIYLLVEFKGFFKLVDDKAQHSPPLHSSESPPTTQSGLPLCTGVQFSHDSMRMFNDWMKKYMRKYTVVNSLPTSKIIPVELIS